LREQATIPCQPTRIAGQDHGRAVEGVRGFVGLDIAETAAVMRCSDGKSPQEITIYVELQRKRLGGVWSTVANDSDRFTNPPAGKKSDPVPAVLHSCPDGTFRTRARASGTDETGARVEPSEWSYSAEVVDPCKRK